MTIAPTSAWDTYARGKPNRALTNAVGEKTWFNWTQYADHGPGAEVLGIGAGAVVLELGCGKGGNLAHIATLGARAVGVTSRVSNSTPRANGGATSHWSSNRVTP